MTCKMVYKFDVTNYKKATLGVSALYFPQSVSIISNMETKFMLC